MIDVLYKTLALFVIPTLITIPGLFSSILKPSWIFYGIIAAIAIVRWLGDFVNYRRRLENRQFYSKSPFDITFNTLFQFHSDNDKIKPDHGNAMNHDAFMYYFNRIQFIFVVLCFTFIAHIFLSMDDHIVVKDLFFSALYLEYFHKTVITIHDVLSINVTDLKIQNQDCLDIYKACQMLQVITAFTMVYTFINTYASNVYVEYFGIASSSATSSVSQFVFFLLQQYGIMCVVSTTRLLDYHFESQLNFILDIQKQQSQSQSQLQLQLQLEQQDSSDMDKANKFKAPQVELRLSAVNSVSLSGQSHHEQAQSGASGLSPISVDSVGVTEANDKKDSNINDDHGHDGNNNTPGIKVKVLKFLKSNQWHISMYLVIITAGVTLIGSAYDESFDLGIYQICIYLLFFSILALGHYHFCAKQVTLNKDVAIPIEWFFCCIICCTCRQYCQLSFRFCHECTRTEIPQSVQSHSLNHYNQLQKNNKHYSNIKNINIDDNHPMVFGSSKEERCTNCLSCCCGACMLYYIYPKDDSKRVITMLNIVLLFLQLQLAYETEQDGNDEDGEGDEDESQKTLNLIAKIGTVLTCVALYSYLFSLSIKKGTGHSTRKTTIEKLTQLGIEHPSWLVTMKFIFQLVVVIVDLYLFIISFAGKYAIYYQIIHKFWIFPLYLVVNEMSQFQQNLNYTLAITQMCHIDFNNKDEKIVFRREVKYYTLAFFENVVELMYLLVVGCVFGLLGEIMVNWTKKYDLEKTPIWVTGGSIILCALCLCLALSFIKIIDLLVIDKDSNEPNVIQLKRPADFGASADIVVEQ